MELRVALAFVWLVACAGCSVNALRCAVTNASAPTEVTLMASPTAPDTDAIVLAPNCSYVTLKVDPKGTLWNRDPISSTYLFLDRVASAPSSAKTLDLNFQRMVIEGIRSGLDLSAASNITSLNIRGGSETALENANLPPSLKDFFVAYSSVSPSFGNVTLPPTITTMSFMVTNLGVLPNLPRNLTYLFLDHSNFTTIDFDYPATLTELTYAYNYEMKNLGPATLPPLLKTFSCKVCNTKSIRGIAWPHTLEQLQLDVWPETEVELRQSDVDFLLNFTKTPFLQGRGSIGYGQRDKENCSDTTATIVNIHGVDVCAICDARFEDQYVKQLAPSDPSEQGSSTDTVSSSRSPSTRDESGGSEERDGGGSDPSPTRANRPPQQTVDGPGNTKAERATRSPETSGESGTDTDESSTSMVTIAVLFGVVVAVALAVTGYRLFFAAKRTDVDKAYRGIESPSNNPTESGTSLCQQNLGGFRVDDIRHDPSMQLFHIELDEVKLGAVVARSHHYETLYGEYNSKPVVVKRLSAEASAAGDEAVMAQFMDEIRLCSTLDHPKIIAFVGVTWSSRQDIALVSEYMDGGDLSTLLYQQPVPASPQDWFEPWTNTKMIKTKAMIARDVVEAMVYLHSFNSPILHRDLKAQNVLVDSQGNAKLSNFGISRELSEDETMTAGVGTVAWIAPEVLRGDRYSEKADIYSFGVLLVELDRCRHPYAEESESRQLTNSQIAMAVVSGELCPSVDTASPQSVKELVAKCVSFDAADRPTAMAVHFALRQMTAIPSSVAQRNTDH